MFAGGTRMNSNEWLRLICEYVEDQITDKLDECEMFDIHPIHSLMLYDYLLRLFKYTNLICKDDRTDECSSGIVYLLMGLVFLQRAQVVFTRKNHFQYIQVSTMMAIKVQEDGRFSMKYWSDVSGCPFDHLLLLEHIFCHRIRFAFGVTWDEIKEKKNLIQ